MMMSGVRVLSLFLGYSLIGFGGDYHRYDGRSVDSPPPTF
jgi:hypothetical protein